MLPIATLAGSFVSIQRIKDRLNKLTVNQLAAVYATFALCFALSWLTVVYKLLNVAKVDKFTVKDRKINQIFRRKVFLVTNTVEEKASAIKWENLVNGNGYGTIVFPDGAEFKGQFQDGLLHGRGEMRFPGGITHSGNFQFGQLHGEGTIIIPIAHKQEVYKGYFEKGVLHGEGSILSSDGVLTKGIFREGVIWTGSGRRILLNKEIWEGNFELGELTGKGKKTLENGDVYEGLFKRGKLNGLGIVTTHDGKISIGIFVNDELVKGKGYLRISDDVYYHGQVEDGRPHGQGEIIEKGKVIRKGRFEKEEFNEYRPL